MRTASWKRNHSKYLRLLYGQWNRVAHSIAGMPNRAAFVVTWYVNGAMGPAVLEQSLSVTLRLS